MDPTSFADKIFIESVKSPCSIQLEGFQDMNMGDLFEFLLIVFTNGLRVLYGDDNGKVELDQLTPDQFDKVNQYFHSFGFDSVYLIYPIVVEDQIDFQKLSYQDKEITPETDLTDLCFPIKVKDKIYVIAFNFYRTGDIVCRSGA